MEYVMDYIIARKNMVNCQLKPNKVTDKNILNAFLDVPRELFVKKNQANYSYLDDNLLIANKRYLINPVTLARLIQALKLNKSQTILHIASGTGYGTVILSYLVNTVLGIESDPKFIKTSSEILIDLEIDNAAIIRGDIVQGYENQSPYDAILIEGRVKKVPVKILKQLMKVPKKLYV